MPEAATTGTQRAAILMMAMGEKAAAEVMRQLSAAEVRRLGEAMGGLSNVSQQQVDEVLQGLHKTLVDTTALGIGATDYVKRVLRQALGDGRANSMMTRIFQRGDTAGLDMLQWMDPRTIAAVLRQEHPQIVAIILSYLDKELASRIGALLPKPLLSDVLMRIATMDGVQEQALKELSAVLEKTFDGDAGAEPSSSGGLRAAADLVNALDGATGAELLELIRENDATLAEQIEELMFVFDDIARIDDRGMQRLLREVQSEDLLLALKGASPALREKIFSNMSQRAAQLLREDLEAKGPVKLSEVEAAQKEIITVVRRLIEAGDIAGGGGGDFI